MRKNDLLSSGVKSVKSFIQADLLRYGYQLSRSEGDDLPWLEITKWTVHNTFAIDFSAVKVVDKIPTACEEVVHRRC